MRGGGIVVFLVFGFEASRGTKGTKWSLSKALELLICVLILAASCTCRTPEKIQRETQWNSASAVRGFRPLRLFRNVEKLR